MRSATTALAVLASGLVLAVGGCGGADAVPTPTPTPTPTPGRRVIYETKKLIASDAGAGDVFGHAVSVSGDTVVVGAAGRAYIFQRHKGGTDKWGEGTKLPAGHDVSVSGDTALVSGGGWTYVSYRHQGGTDRWGEVTKVEGQGYLSLDGDTALVGERVLHRNRGGDDAWGQVATLARLQPPANETFGVSFSVSGDAAFVGAYSSFKVSGAAAFVGADRSQQAMAGSDAVYVFHRNQGGTDVWGQVTRLVSPWIGSFGESFGRAVAVSGDRAVVGEPLVPLGAPHLAYVFYRHKGGTDNWGHVASLVVPGTESEGGSFGGSVSISGDMAVVGDADAGESHSGAAYVFSRNEGGADNWGLVARLIASDATAGDRFGARAAVSGDVAVVGDPYDDQMGENAGAAYVFNIEPGTPASDTH